VKTEKIIGLRNCPACGSPAVLRKNASKRFQVHCKNCDWCTAWTSKPESIVKWYNNAKIYEEINGITPPPTGKTAEEKLADTSKDLASYVENLKAGGIINADKLKELASELLKIAKE